MKKLSLFGAILASSVLAISTAQAAVNFTAGYQNNRLNNTDGLLVEASGVVKNIEVGVNTQLDISKPDVNTYGAFAGLPYTLNGIHLTVSPEVSFDHYKEGNFNTVGLGVSTKFNITPKTKAVFKFKTAKSIDKDVDLDGNTYTFGVTQVF